MVELWIFLGTIIAVLAIIGICVLVSRIKEKMNDQKLERYFNKEGQGEIESLESFMRENKIRLPNRNWSEGALVYVKSLIRDTHWHFECVLRSNLRAAGYANYVDLDKVGRIYYNAESVLIYKDVFFYIEPSVKNGFTYTHRDACMKEIYWSLEDFFEFCRKLEKPDAYKNLAEEIETDNFHWYMRYPASLGYKLANTGAGAVVGGILLGPVGLLAGALGASNSQDKELKEQIEVFVVFGSIPYSIAKGAYRAEDMMKKLAEHFPNNRLPDKFIKNI